MVRPTLPHLSTSAKVVAAAAAVLLTGVMVVAAPGAGVDGPVQVRRGGGHATSSRRNRPTQETGSTSTRAQPPVPERTVDPGAQADLPDARAAARAQTSTTVPMDPRCGLECALPAGAADAAVIPDDEVPPVHRPLPIPSLPDPAAATAQPPFRQAPG